MDLVIGVSIDSPYLNLLGVILLNIPTFGNRDDKPRSHGQTLVEFMLVLPLLLLMMLAIIEIARVMHAWLAVVNGARYGVRYAVTNTYDDANCPVGGCTTDAEKEQARLESIREATIAGSVSILRDLGETDWAKPGYFEVTVCSESASGYTPSDTNNWTSDWTADCSPSDHAGNQGDLVWVTVDFNHPLIAPWLSADWPMLHLTSRRDAVVESFRTVRFVGAGPFTPAPTLTPSLTPTASDTPLATDTPTATATPCQALPITTIIEPIAGATYSSGDILILEAEAYDPDNADPENCTGVGANGLGIDRVKFDLDWWNGSSWESMDNQVEQTVAYCGFGGGDPSCNYVVIGDDSWPSTGQVIRSGLHRLRAQALDDEGDWGEWDIVEFTIDAPPTPTPTCSGVTFGPLDFDSSARIEQPIENTTYPGLQVTGVTVIWDALQEGSDINNWNYHIDWMEWDGIRINNGDDYTSSTSDNNNMPRSADLGSHMIEIDWDGAYGGRLSDDPPGLEARHFGFSVQFSDSDCNLYKSADSMVWPTPTITPTPEPTEVPSCSDIYITRGEINGDDAEARVRNDNEAPATLVSATLNWPSSDLSPAYVDYFKFNGNRYWGGNDSSSPTGPISSSVSMSPGSTERWEADFDGQSGEIWGNFSIDLTFDIDGWLTCSMSVSFSVPEPPPPTDTPEPSNTPVASNTPDPTDTPEPTATDDDATPPVLED